jgi:hypothetical protein
MIHFGYKALRVVGVRDDDADQPPVLVVRGRVVGSVLGVRLAARPPAASEIGALFSRSARAILGGVLGKPMELLSWRNPDAPDCRRRGVLHRVRSFLRLVRHDAGCGDWFEELPPDSFVREPRRPRLSPPSSAIALELPREFT